MLLEANLNDGLSVSVPRTFQLPTSLRSTDQVYGGVRQASKYLQESGVPRAERVRILQAFDNGTVSFRQAGSSEFGIRYFSNPSRPGGSWLFETFPASR